MDSPMEKIDTADDRKRPSESSEADVASKKVKDDHNSVDPRAEGKGKDVVVVSGIDSTGDNPLKKSIDLGNVTTTGSNQVILKQEILEVDDTLKKFVGTTKAVVDVRKKLKERLRQQNLPGGICIQKDTSDDYKNMIKEVKAEHDKTMQQFNNSILHGGGSLEVDSAHPDDVNQSAGETATEGKGKYVVVSEESQEISKKQSVDPVKTTTEPCSSDHDLGKTTESGGSSDNLEDIEED